MAKKNVTGKQLVMMLKKLGCEVVRQKGSHVRMRCGICDTTIPVHSNQSLGPGLLRSIERDLEPCLGKGWLS